jgi:TPR repeat protein
MAPSHVLVLFLAAAGPQVEELQAACDAGRAAACASLGALYRQGLGVPVDECRAATLFDRACTGGAADGCVGLGLMFEDGLCLEQDGSRAAALYEKACAGRSAMGCKNLGDLYLSGEGVARNPVRAVAYYKQACALGSASACDALPFEVEAGIRGELGVRRSGWSATVAVEGEVSRGAFSGAVAVFIQSPVVLRAEARYHPFEWGRARPYLAMGAALALPVEASASPGFGGHAALGVDVQLGRVHVLAGVAYEHFLAAPTQPYEADYLLASLGAGWGF